MHCFCLFLPVSVAVVSAEDIQLALRGRFCSGHIYRPATTSHLTTFSHRFSFIGESAWWTSDQFAEGLFLSLTRADSNVMLMMGCKMAF